MTKKKTIGRSSSKKIPEDSLSDVEKILRKENWQGQSVLCYLPYGCLGRDDEYEALKQMMETRTPVVLYGAPGIGKTALCSYYYKKQREIKPDFFMLYIDVSGCGGLEKFTQSISSAIGMDSTADLKYIMEYLLKYRDNYQVILFDNWEELQCGMVNTASWGLICNYINLLASNEIRILISSQERISNGWDGFELFKLQDDYGQMLFERLLLRQGKELKKGNEEYQAFEHLLECMDNHPLTMILTASLVEGKDYDLRRIQDRWIKVYNMTEVGKHRSLKTALKLSFDAVSSIEGAVLLWGIMSKLTMDFPVSFMKLLKDISPDILWDDAEYALVRRCLVNNTEIQALHMLMPVKLQWQNLAANEVQDACLEKWGTLLPTILEASDAPRYTHDPERSNPLKEEVLLAFEDFLQITETLIENNMMEQAEACISKLEPYYELVAECGSAFLEGLPIERFSQEVQGTIYRCRADIIRLNEPGAPECAQNLYEKALSCFERCNSYSGIAYVKNTMGLNHLWNYRNIRKALECFEESEKLSRNYGYDMCLAETLKNKGILLTNEFVQYEEAQVCYEEAELLYKKIGDVRGLAHVTKRMGVIEWNKGEADLAIEYFEKALPLYQQAHYTQGMADTISRLCLAYMDKGDEKKLRKICKEGNYLYDKIPYEITRKDLKENMDRAQAWLLC